MALLDRVKSKSFLRSSCQGLSEYVVGSSGIQFFTRLDSGEQWYQLSNLVWATESLFNKKFNKLLWSKSENRW